MSAALPMGVAITYNVEAGKLCCAIVSMMRAANALMSNGDVMFLKSVVEMQRAAGWPMPGIVRGNAAKDKYFGTDCGQRAGNDMAVSSRDKRSGRPTERQEKGKAGEEAALSHLARQGLVLLERNFRCRGGEIDLIMRDGENTVFVEVRTRQYGGFGGAAASITAAKRARLIVAAQVFLQRFRNLPACRFDVVAIDGDQISWLKNVIEY